MEAGHIASTHPLPWLTEKRLAALLLVVPVALMTMLIMIANHGMFIYTLDDPYIHIALAKQIFSGHYGINPHEFSAPSSSIAWPFILAPFALLGSAMVYVPFVLNLAFAYLTISLFIKLLGELPALNKLIVLGGFFFAINFYGLIFTGMEHSLQVYLVAMIACAVVRKEFGAGGVTPLPVFVALILLPWVRYEGLAVSLPVLAYLFWLGERRRAMISGAIMMALIIGFSLFLHRLGLGYLPSSVLAKTNMAGLPALVFNIISQSDKYGWVILAQLFVCVLFFDRKPLIAMLISVTVLHTLFGRWGWFGRYEVYWLMFVGVFVLHACVTRLRVRYITALFAMLPVAFATLVNSTLSVPLASAAIYNQQYSMSMITRELHEPVAVNDLGLVALNSNQYILDLWGLGSIEALNFRRTQAGVQWMTALMDAKSVHYAFVYDEWFPEKPKNWIEVAELKLTIPKASSASRSVFYYATDVESAKKLKAVMEHFLEQTPNARFTLDFATGTPRAGEPQPAGLRY
jgi:hypothetical protein